MSAGQIPLGGNEARVEETGGFHQEKPSKPGGKMHVEEAEVGIVGKSGAVLMSHRFKVGLSRRLSEERYVT